MNNFFITRKEFNISCVYLSNKVLKLLPSIEWLSIIFLFRTFAILWKFSLSTYNDFFSFQGCEYFDHLCMVWHRHFFLMIIDIVSWKFSILFDNPIGSCCDEYFLHRSINMYRHFEKWVSSIWFYPIIMSKDLSSLKLFCLSSTSCILSMWNGLIFHILLSSLKSYMSWTVEREPIFLFCWCMIHYMLWMYCILCFFCIWRKS